MREGARFSGQKTLFISKSDKSMQILLGSRSPLRFIYLGHDCADIDAPFTRDRRAERICATSKQFTETHGDRMNNAL